MEIPFSQFSGDYGDSIGFISDGIFSGADAAYALVSE